MNYKKYYGEYGPLIMSSMDKERYDELEDVLKGLIRRNIKKYENKFSNENCK